MQSVCILDQQATFIFGSSFIYEEKTVSHHTDVFINCSVEPSDEHTFWEFKNTHIYSNNKYSVNISGLTIHNVTEEDKGQYICFLHTLNATILLDVFCKLLSIYMAYIFIIIILGSSEMGLSQNTTVQANGSEEVTSNCNIYIMHHHV